MASMHGRNAPPHRADRPPARAVPPSRGIRSPEHGTACPSHRADGTTRNLVASIARTGYPSSRASSPTRRGHAPVRGGKWNPRPRNASRHGHERRIRSWNQPTRGAEGPMRRSVQGMQARIGRTYGREALSWRLSRVRRWSQPPRRRHDRASRLCLRTLPRLQFGKEASA